MLLIQDNGCGISKEDLPVVCERFTTSKLKTFEDLTSINTYGFRGEALASISHVAHVTITTRTSIDKCAYKAIFSDGKLLSQRPGVPPEPKPCAGNQGTQISIEDLFYNMPTRRNALKSHSEEYHKMVDVVGKYAVHNTGVGFTLKKSGECTVDVRTSPLSTTTENIGLIFGQSIARELLDISCESNKFAFKMTGYITNANYSLKKFQFLLFINHRLVDCSSLRKAIETVYNAYLPKNAHPFVYISIDILSSNIDVNVHPTKHEVHFLYEGMIVEEIQKCIEDRLLGCNESRTYYTQTLLPGMALPISLEEDPTKGSKENVYAHQMIRTDAKEQSLDSFVIPTSVREFTNSLNSEAQSIETSPPSVSGEKSISHKRKSSDSILSTVKRRKHHKPVQLTSINNLLVAVKDRQHHELSSLFNEHKFVGSVDQTRALIQHQTKLYLVNLTKVTQDLFYQLVLLDFANFTKLQLNPPAPLYKLALLGLDSSESGWTSEDGPKESLAKYLVDFLKGKSEMLEDYFSLKINAEGCLVSLPVLLESFTPNLDRLSVFILRLATEVDWEKEHECFEGIAKEFSLFYRLQHDPFLVDSKEEIQQQQNTTCEPSLIKTSPWQWIVEHVLFPAFRTDLVPSHEMASDGSILQIADLKELYKVFERC